MMPVPWFRRLPRGLREQPGWVFIGLLVFLTGLGYMAGITTSVADQAVGKNGLRVWGAFLALSGFLVTYATLRAKPSVEKLALRWLSLSVFAYIAWIAIIVPVGVAAMTLTLGVILIGLAEIRVAHIKSLFTVATRMKDRGEPL